MTADLILTNIKITKTLKTALYLHDLIIWKNFMINGWVSKI